VALFKGPRGARQAVKQFDARGLPVAIMQIAHVLGLTLVYRRGGR